MHASDVLRRLGLLRVGELATLEPADGVIGSAPRIAAHATLRDALARLLLDGEPLLVVDDDRPRGVLRFATISEALRS